MSGFFFNFFKKYFFDRSKKSPRKNEDFQNFVSNLSIINLKQKSNLDKLIKSEYSDTKEKVSDALTNLISKIGENLTIRRCNYMKTNDGFVGTYVHNVEKDDMGKIGVLVSVKTNIEFSIINDFLKNGFTKDKF